MKKSIITFIMGIVLIFSFTGCSNDKTSTIKSAASKFKAEYEELNNKENESNGKEYRYLEINEENAFKYKSTQDIINMMEEKETFVVYFGFASCPWCRSVVPTLMEVTDDLGIFPIYYVDIKEIRDIMIINEKGKVVTKEEGTDEYYQLLEKMTHVLEDYILTDEENNEVDTGEKRIYAPNIVSVIDGEAVQMTDGISPNQTDAYMELTEEITEESYDKIKCSIECVANSIEICSVKKKC